jgi:hypothetical protein
MTAGNLASRVANLETEVGEPGSPNGRGSSGLHAELHEMRAEIRAMDRRIAVVESRIGAPDSADDGGPTGLYSALASSTKGIAAPDPRVRWEAWARTVLVLVAMALTAFLARR